MEGHAARPDLDDVTRHLDEAGEIIEQHIADTAARDDTKVAGIQICAYQVAVR